MVSRAFNLSQFGNTNIIDVDPTANTVSIGDTILPSGGPLSNRNKIINGNFDIWQRGTSFSSPAANSYQAIREWEAEGNTITTPAPDVDAAWSKLRAERDAKLAASDWIVVKSYEAGEPVPQVWSDYRQALRDLPANTTDPFNPVWPQEPV